MEANWITAIVAIISSLIGGGGIISFIRAKQLNKATLEEKEANTMLIESNVAKISQGVYQDIIKDLKNEIAGLRNEVFMLREIVENYKSKCEGCPMNNAIIADRSYDTGADVTPAPNND